MTGFARIGRAAALCAVLGLSAGARAAEYFVATDGDDANDGRARETAFATVQRGVDALEPGDTLTIAPGEYFGPVRHTGLGRTGEDEGPRTVIRAEIAGTAVLRGDVPAPEFRPADGYQFVYVADWDGDTEVQTVNEIDTLVILRRVLNPTEIEFNPGTFYQDRENDKLYISSSDLSSPQRHAYTLSVTPEHGLYLMEPQRVTIEGIGVTGFNNAVQIDYRERTHRATFGIFLTQANDCVIRDCRAWLNGRGIGMNPRATGGDNAIDGCIAWANDSINAAGGGALTLFEPARDEIRNSAAFLNGRIGILLYIGGERGRVYNSVSWGNATDFQLKADQDDVAERSVGAGSWASDAVSRRAVHSLIGHIRELGPGYRDNIHLADHPDLDMNAEFADPANHDYRLQSTSRFRGQAADGSDLGPYQYEPSIFYLSEDGDDEAGGLSVSSAWGSLRHALEQISPGDTLYIEPGEYSVGAPVAISGNGDGVVTVRGRGRGTVSISGPVGVEGASVSLARLTFRDAVGISGAERAEVESCRFLGGPVALDVDNVEELRVTHSAFKGFAHAGINVHRVSGVFAQGNYFDNRAAPALMADVGEAILHTDYNAYAADGHVVHAEGRIHGLWEFPGHHDTHSGVAGEPFPEGGSARLADDVSLAVSGPYGSAIGPHNPAADYEHDEVRLAGPRVHSATATTANIEWWTSSRASLSVAWGTSRDLGEGEAIAAHLAGSFSLAGLEPDTEYFFRLGVDAPLKVLDSFADGEVAEDSVTISFRTAAEDPEPAVYYVAPDGDNSNSGLSRDEAWRTVNHAADRARPGDTVMIAGGTYHESVRVRATGDEGRPITFRSLPGEKVVFDGNERTLTNIFYVTDKAHINIDGFYFTDLARGGATPWPDSRNGAINLYRSRNVNITRCYLDGSGAGPYSPGLLQAHHCSDVLVQNCVVFSTMGGGIGFAATPDMRIENNVFFRNFISHISEAINTSDQTFYIRNNIFTDNLPGKVGGSLFNIGRVEAMVEDNNAFYLRIPFEERTMWMLYDKVAYERAARAEVYSVDFDPDEPYAVQELRRWTHPEYRERFNPDSTSFAADPGFEGTLDMERVDEDGNPVYVIDQFRGRISREADLEHDFNILFATNPEVVERGIGLQREAFEDFHFAQ